jgi:hypothetical protein
MTSTRAVTAALRLGLALGLSSLAAAAQSPLFDKPAQSESKSSGRPDAVAYLYPEQVTLPAGTSTHVTLHFRVAAGLHINSHDPKDEFLIPTNLTIPEASGVQLERASYPPGIEFTLPVEPKTRLSVYTGEFAIQTQMIAQPGHHFVEAKLRYQACDQNACLPPKTITVPIDVIGK